MSAITMGITVSDIYNTTWTQMHDLIYKQKIRNRYNTSITYSLIH